MPAVANVAVNIDTRTAAARLKALNGNLRTTNTALKGTAASSAAASKGLAAVGATMAKILGPIVAVTTAVQTVTSSFKVLGEREADLRSLATGLGNLGAAQKDLQKLNKAADELGDATLFRQEDFTKGFALLTSFRNIGVDAYKEVAEQAANVAQANQVDVKTSFMQLAKALQDPARNLSALNRSGIAFTKQQTEQINALMKSGETAQAHAMILGIVEESYNNLARAAGSGFAGRVDELGENFRDFQETLANDLKPAIQTIVVGLKDLFDNAKFVDSVSLAFKTLLFPINAVVKLFQGFGEALKANMSPQTLEAINGAWTKIVSILQAGFKDGEQFFRIIGRIAGLLTTVFVSPVEAVIGIFKKISTWWSNYMKPELDETWKEMGDNLKEKFGAPINWIKEKWTGMVDHFKSEITKFWDNLPEAVKNFFAWIGQGTEQVLRITVGGTKSEDTGPTSPTVPEGGGGKKPPSEDAKKYATVLDVIKDKWGQITDIVAGGLTNAVMGLIDGTKSLGESLAGIAKSLASMFLQAGFKSMLSGVFQAEGGYNGGSFKAFAKGGLVSSPTIGLVGEAGEDEYIIPASKMSGAMDRYSAGARGQAVIPGGGTVASGSGVSSTPTVVNYTGPVLSFNSEAYVPKSAIPEIINSAARRGAQEGQSKVFSQLKNSRSQRSRVGL